MNQYRRPRVGEPHVEMVWTCIAAEQANDDGVMVPDPTAPGTRMLERAAHFAYRAEAVAWLAEQEAEGFTPGTPVPCATASYHGLTDAPSNCWAARAQREVHELAVADAFTPPAPFSRRV